MQYDNILKPCLWTKYFKWDDGFGLSELNFSPFSEKHSSFQGQNEKLLYLTFMWWWNKIAQSLLFVTSSVSETKPKAFSESIWKWRRDDSKCICGHWISVTQKHFLIWYRRVMPSLVPGDISVQIAVPDRGVNKVGVVVFDWMNVGRPSRKTGPATVVSTAVVSCDCLLLHLALAIW